MTRSKPIPSDSPVLFDRDILTPATSLMTLNAAAAIRSFHSGLSGGKLPFRTLEDGYLRLPYGAISELSNVHGGVPFPTHAEVAWGSGEERTALFVFTDRSALLAIEETEVGQNYSSMMRISPTVYSLPARLDLPLRQSLEISCKARGKSDPARADIALALKDHDSSDKARPLSEQHPLYHAFMAELHREMRDCRRDALTMPLIVDPGHEGVPRRGVLGSDCPAPTPELEGRAYEWPAALPWANFDTESFKPHEAFFRLAWTRLWEEFPGIEQWGIMVRAGAASPRHSGPARISIEAQAIDANRHQPELAQKISRRFEELLAHSEAPFGILDLTMTIEDFANKGKTRTKLIVPALFRGISDSDIPSAHERLRAARVFGSMKTTGAID